MSPKKFKAIKGLVFLFIPLLYVSLGTMMNVYESNLPFIDWTRLLVSLVGLFVILNSTYLVKRQKSRLLSLLLWLMLLIIGATFFKHVYAFRAESVRELADSIMWISVLFWAYKISYESDNIFTYAPLLAWFIPLFTITFLNVRMFILFDEGDDAMRATAYYPMMLLPLALLNKNILIRWGLIIITLITILLSSKRGGFVTLFVGLAVYYYVRLLNKKSFFRILLFIVGGVVIYFAMMNFMEFFIAENDLTILDRLANASEDMGSGRDEVWVNTWAMIMHSDPFSMMFGHGFNAVYSDSNLELSAHNDFLEIIYDFGFVGFIIYMALYVKLYKYYKKMKKYMPEIASPFAASIAIALSLSMVAHLVINPMQFMFLTMFWGFCIAECDKCIQKNNALYERSC